MKSESADFRMPGQRIPRGAVKLACFDRGGVVKYFITIAIARRRKQVDEIAREIDVLDLESLMRPILDTIFRILFLSFHPSFFKYASAVQDRPRRAPCLDNPINNRDPINSTPCAPTFPSNSLVYEHVFQ